MDNTFFLTSLISKIIKELIFFHLKFMIVLIFKIKKYPSNMSFVDTFAKDFFFYRKFNVRLFKLIYSLIPCPNPLAPSFPIEFDLNFCF
jgi:hypothetical protein